MLESHQEPNFFHLDTPGWLSGAIQPPDVDTEDTAPLSTSPSADEGVDLSDAMFSFDDDMILSPPGCPITYNSTAAGGSTGSFPRVLSMGVGGFACCYNSATNAIHDGSNSDEDAPRTPVAVPTYQLSNSCSFGASSSLRNHRGCSTTTGLGTNESNIRGTYFTRSQASLQKSQVRKCARTLVVFLFFFFGGGGGGGLVVVIEIIEKT